MAACAHTLHTRTHTHVQCTRTHAQNGLPAPLRPLRSPQLVLTLSLEVSGHQH